MHATIKKGEHPVENCMGSCMYKTAILARSLPQSSSSWLFTYCVGTRMGVGLRKEWAGTSRKDCFFWQQHQLTFQTTEQLAHKKKNLAHIGQKSELRQYKHYITSHELKHPLQQYLKTRTMSHTWRKVCVWEFQLHVRQSWSKIFNTHSTQLKYEMLLLMLLMNARTCEDLLLLRCMHAW